jgi:AAA15 family ATPase/GTPase
LIVKATSQDAGLIVDELDAELHPLLLRHFVSRFHGQDVRAQLIFTTHDLSLLDKRYLRRDRVWFSAKDGAGHSVLRSLADFKVRNDSSFGDAYLAGIFGAIPNIARKGEDDGNR